MNTTYADKYKGTCLQVTVDVELVEARGGVALGGFNAPTIYWSFTSADCSELEFNHQPLHLTESLLLTQNVTFPKRILEGQQMNCLNLVLTKSPYNIDIVNLS
ncbi:unnamed protein product [Dibothriocephalus latus]|uniref:Uncharacterized protein n=1 Tax=Dibothriocephalus latus TaxID=60516 RepID=A0A3P7L4M1_DIBLA|nr:unnamed protein product [Dibothriocephalus latus]